MPRRIKPDSAPSVISSRATEDSSENDLARRTIGARKKIASRSLSQEVDSVATSEGVRHKREMAESMSGRLLSAGLCSAKFELLKQRQMSIVDFENADAKAGRENATAFGTMIEVVRLPASCMLTLLELRVDEEVSHLDVPLIPLLASQVMEDLSGVVPVIQIPSSAVGRMLFGQPTSSGSQSWIVIGPAEVHAAEQRFRRHAWLGASLLRQVGVASAVVE